ncbi:hypothetical protein ACHAWF_003267 [Thalassiosira exigua]
MSLLEFGGRRTTDCIQLCCLAKMGNERSRIKYPVLWMCMMSLNALLHADNLMDHLG